MFPERESCPESAYKNVDTILDPLACQCSLSLLSRDVAGILEHHPSSRGSRAFPVHGAGNQVFFLSPFVQVPWPTLGSDYISI